VSATADWSAAFASAGFDTMVVYNEILVPRLFAPWAEVLLDEVGVAPGASVLDVGCGPGTVARRAATRVGPSGRVTGCDVSPAMLAVATANRPLDGAADITYLQCPADHLAVADGAFEVVVCQQALQFFPDRAAALAEMRRALPAGGRAGVSVWCPIEESPPFEAMASGLGKILGRETEAAYRGGPWGLTDPDELGGLLADAGFSDVRVTRHILPVEFDGGPAQMAASLAVASVGPQVAALDEQGRARLVDAIGAALGPSPHPGRVRSETATWIARATR
jgi:SAM-dependent methyltransferase